MLSVVLAALSTAAAPPPRQCIETSPAPVGWIALDDHTLIAHAGPRSFKVTTSTCPSLKDPLPRISLVLGGGSSICDPRDARLFVSHDDLIPTPCFMQTIELITPEQEKALMKAGRKR